MTSEPTPLSRVKPHARCPNCNNPHLTRMAAPQVDTVSMNGASLYSVSEACTICKWNRVVENVKLGV